MQSITFARFVKQPLIKLLSLIVLVMFVAAVTFGGVPA
jgi:hypothetical protein